MYRLALIVLLVVGGVLGWRWLFPDDEAQIRGILERIAETVSGDAADDGLSGLAQLAALQEEFAADAIVDAGPPFAALRGPQAIVGAAARVRAVAPDLELSFPDVEIAVAEERTTATASVTAEARFRTGGEQRLDARELELTFATHDGRWVMTSAKVVQALRPLP